MEYSVEISVQTLEPLTLEQIEDVAAIGGAASGTPGKRRIQTTLTVEAESMPRAADLAIERVTAVVPGDVIALELMPTQEADRRLSGQQVTIPTGPSSDDRQRVSIESLVEAHVPTLDLFARQGGGIGRQVSVTLDEARAFIKDPMRWWKEHHECTEQELRAWVYDATSDGFGNEDGRYLRCIAQTKSRKRCKMPVSGGDSPRFEQWLEYERSGGAYCTVHEQGTS